ncbi:MAG: hypothetical protein ACRDFB_07600 [Rhabdochlamydiaceae bacterium]
MDDNRIGFGKSWEEFDDEKLNITGIFVEINGNQYLIGDINALRGVCDDCTAFDKEEIVTRYKKIFKPE